MSNENFICLYIPNVIVCPKLAWNNSRIRLKFKGSCLKQEDKGAFTPKNVVNLFIVYELDTWSENLSTDFTLKYSFFRSVKLTKKDHPDKYKYSGYAIGFDSRSESSFTDESMGKNVIIFGADMRSSVHSDNKNKDILILGEGLTKGLDDTELAAEAKHPVNFTPLHKNFI